MRVSERERDLRKGPTIKTMERDQARDYDGSSHIGMGWWWVFSRALAFLSILLMIAWSGLSSGDEKRSYHVQANGQPIWRSSSAKQPLIIKESELLQIMKKAYLFMEGQLYTTPETPRKTVQSVTLSFEDSISVPLATIQSNIYMSSKYNIMGNFEGNHSTVELERVIYTAMAHVWLWNGKGNAPLGLMGAMANLFTSFAPGLEARNTIAEVVTSPHLHDDATIEDEGGQQQWAWSLWDSYHEEQSLATSFLAFCEGAKPGFLSALNSKLEHGWNQSYFQDLLNRTVDDLWEDFKALKLHNTIQ